MPMFVEIQFLKLFTLKKIMKLIMKLDAYTVRVVEIHLVMGMLRMIKFGMLLEKDSLLYMMPSKILFFF